MILSATMMLRHLGLDYHANQISKAVYKVLAERKIRTPDMGGSHHTTGQFRVAFLAFQPDFASTDFTFATTRAL